MKDFIKVHVYDSEMNNPTLLPINRIQFVDINWQDPPKAKIHMDYSRVFYAKESFDEVKKLIEESRQGNGQSINTEAVGFIAESEENEDE